MSSQTSTQPTMEASTTDLTDLTTVATTTIKSTTTASTETEGMSPGTMAGIVIGAIVALCVVVIIMTLMLIRYKAKQRKGSDKYKQKKKELKIDKLPSPSEIESAEIRPLERKPTKNPEIETDFSSSTNPYQNVTNSKYENVDKDVPQPIYMEPKGEDKRIYNTAEGSEYYLVGEGRTPKLPNRDDVSNNKTKASGQNPAKGKSKQNQHKTKPSQTSARKSESSDSSGSESDTNNSTLHSKGDYINLQDEPIAPPQHIITKGRTQNLVVDDVYENEEVKHSTRSKTKR